jgi:hypothetical protein
MFRTSPESATRHRLPLLLTTIKRTKRIRTLSRTHLGTRWTPPTTRAPVSPHHLLHQEIEPLIPATRTMIVLHLRYLTHFPSHMRYSRRRFQLIRIVRWWRIQCHSPPSLGLLRPLALGRPQPAALVPAQLHLPSARRWLVRALRGRERRRPFPSLPGEL